MVFYLIFYNYNLKLMEVNKDKYSFDDIAAE